MTNQASEDTLTYGVDRGIPGGDFTALSIKKGSTLFTFVGDEAVAIIDVIRNEKLKLLAEVMKRVVGEYETEYSNLDGDAGYWEKHGRNGMREKQIEELTKLEAEL